MANSHRNIEKRSGPRSAVDNDSGLRHVSSSANRAKIIMASPNWSLDLRQRSSKGGQLENTIVVSELRQISNPKDAGSPESADAGETEEPTNQSMPRAFPEFSLTAPNQYRIDPECGLKISKTSKPEARDRHNASSSRSTSSTNRLESSSLALNASSSGAKVSSSVLTASGSRTGTSPATETGGQ